MHYYTSTMKYIYIYICTCPFIYNTLTEEERVVVKRVKDILRRGFCMYNKIV